MEANTPQVTRAEALEVARGLTDIEAAALLSGESEWDSRALPGRGIPSFVMSDGPHGVRRQLGSGDHLGLGSSEPATCFPTAATLANSWDPQLAEEMGEALGQEALALGVDVLLGPGLNIKRNPLCGRNFEYYSEDPVLAGRMAAGLVRGIQSRGVAATPKHFAVNSQELRRMASDSVVDERTLREIYLTAFEIVVREAHPRALMSSYNKVNGTYAHENAHLLTEILREEWGFDGMVVSDWGGSNSAVDAARAGGSLEMPAPGLDSARQLAAAVAGGHLDREVLDERAAEIITLAQQVCARSERPELEAEAHHELARRVAEESFVLLRNERGILPLAPGARIALIGDMATTPRYQGSGSSQINPTRLPNLLDVVRADPDLDLVGHAQGYDRQGAERLDLIVEAVDLAARADVVVVAMGLDELSESEGLDRTHMRIPRVQAELLAAVSEANPNVVAVLSAGSAVELDWMRHTTAVLHTSLSGQAGAEATVNVLTGRVSPSGRLAETYPLRLEDVPSSEDFPARGPISAYREGPYVGYRYFTTAGVEVGLPFGFGLSYAHVEYEGIDVDRGGARVTVRNTSERATREVVQLYVSSPGGVWGPSLELKGFAKVGLGPGERRTVHIPFDDYTFRHFDTAANAWAVEGGTWTIRVGRNVADLPLEASVEVEGVHAPEADARLGTYLTGQVREVSDEQFEVLLGRPIPTPEVHDGLVANDPLLEMDRAHSRLARLTARVLASRRAKAEASGKPDLNVLFIQNMPFRAMAKMTRGAVTPAMVDGILDAVNGHPLRGGGALIRAFLAGRRAEARTREQIRDASA